MNTPIRYSFGPFVLDMGRRELARDGVPVHMAPKELDLLVLLLENAGRVVEKAEILSRVWPSTFVEEGNITQAISVLRKSIEGAPGMAGCIRTVAKHGYRFECPVTAIEPAALRRTRLRLTPALAMIALAVVAAGLVAIYWPRIFPPMPHLYSVVLPPVEDRTPGKTAGGICDLLLQSIERNVVRVKPMTVILAQRELTGPAANFGQVAQANKADAALAASVEARGRFIHVRVGLWRGGRAYPEWSLEFEFLPEDASIAAAYIGDQTRAQLEIFKSK